MPTINLNVILAAIGYAVLTGALNLIFSRKTQIEQWCAANPRLAALGMFMRSVGFDPHNLWAFATLLIAKKLPAIKLANSDVVKAEVKKIEEKASKKGPPDDPNGSVSLMPDPIREVAQDRSRLHNDKPELPDEPAEMSKWRHPDWRLQLVFGVLLACVLSCAAEKRLPCDESKLRAIDEAYAAKVLDKCLAKYDSKEACPAFAGLQAEHKRQLQEACP